MDIVLCLKSILSLKQRLNNISTVIGDDKLANETAALDCLIDEVRKTKFTSVIMVVGHPESFTDIEMPKWEIDNCTTIMIFIDPSKFVISLLRRYFRPEGAPSHEVEKGGPLGCLCDRYYATCDRQYKYRRAYYMEGLISNDDLTEFGRKGINSRLKKWLVDFYKTASIVRLSSNQGKKEGEVKNE